MKKQHKRLVIRIFFETLTTEFYEEHTNPLDWTMDWIVKNLPTNFDEKILEKELAEKERALDVYQFTAFKKSHGKLQCIW